MKIAAAIKLSDSSPPVSFRCSSLPLLLSLLSLLPLLIRILSPPTAIAMTPPSSPVTVHFLQLSDAAAEELRQNPDLHRVLWQLTDLDRPPLPLDETPTTTMTWPGIAEGDLVVFPALLTGAGEFEGMKFVGPKSAIVWSTDDGGGEEGNQSATRTLPLLTAGIEYPEFPVLVANMAKGRNQSLRDMYEAAFEIVLADPQPPGNGKLTLRDLMSGDDEAVEQFWGDPPMARRRGPVGRRGGSASGSGSGSSSPWSISLGECAWIRSVVAISDSDEGVGREEKEEPDL
ncbi:hypothetical protein ACHAXS_004878 [Conticribra weissflogii]